MKHTLKEWFFATRFWSFPVSTMPVVVTFSYLLSQGMISVDIKTVICLILTLLGVVILHSAGNVLSDYFDYKTGVDNPDAFAVPNLVFNKFEAREYLFFAVGLFAIGIIIGIALCVLTGWVLLLIGGIGVILTAAYSLLKYNALGDLDIFIIFSCLIMLGTSYALTGEMIIKPLILALPVGIITVAVLHANNTFDIDTDKKAGMKSFAMILGGKVSARLYQVYMVIPFIYMIAIAVCGLVSPLALICLASFVPALKNIKSAATFDEKGIGTMAGLDQATAKLQLVFSGLLSIGLIISSVI